MAAPHVHSPVLFAEALAALAIRPAGCYLDGTFGRGGHSGAILERLGEEGRLLAMDKDPEAVAYAQKVFGEEKRFIVKQGSFAMLEQWVQENGLTGRVDGILLDLGVSSPQLEAPERGFSFLRDGPLDMRMDNTAGISAARWLAEAEEHEIAMVLQEYGEERFAKRIARAIVAARQEAPIATTGRLAALIEQAVPVREKGKHPATRSFQAIRIFLNRELEDLQVALDQSLRVLAPGGRLAVISFHSLEDRMVKRFIRDHARGDDFPPGVPVTAEMLRPRLKPVGKAIHPGEVEIVDNPRARSAVLRVAERLA
jgi:16S rRNA (cytosine1402-N4)-methyltransferase